MANDFLIVQTDRNVFESTDFYVLKIFRLRIVGFANAFAPGLVHPALVLLKSFFFPPDVPIEQITREIETLVLQSFVVKKIDSSTSFYQLNPDFVLAATEDAGFHPTGAFSQLNSYENRVFDIKLEDEIDKLGSKQIIAKFYRPGRWNLHALQEEHQFLFDLQAEGIPVVAPIKIGNGSVLNHNGIYVAFFPKFRGRMPEEFLTGDLAQIGRRLAQIHNVGSRRKFLERGVWSQTPFSGWDQLEILSNIVAPEVWPRYESAAIALLERIEEEIDTSQFIRIHGDCHRGNLLLRPQTSGQKEFFFVDFDDCLMGPAAQDFWMLFSTSEQKSELMSEEKEQILKGYEELRPFPEQQWQWLSLLRGYRILYYSAWIARRWSDPSFPLLFPNFETYSFWAEETEALESIAWSLG